MKVQTIEELIQEYYNNITPVDYETLKAEFKQKCFEYYPKSRDKGDRPSSDIKPTLLEDLKHILSEPYYFFRAKRKEDIYKIVEVYCGKYAQHSYYVFGQMVQKGYKPIYPNDEHYKGKFDQLRFLIEKSEEMDKDTLNTISIEIDKAFAELEELQVEFDADITRATEWATQRHEEQKKAFEIQTRQDEEKAVYNAAQCASLRMKAKAKGVSMLDLLLAEKRDSYSYDELKAASELVNDGELSKVLKEKGLEKKRVDGVTRWIPQQPLSAHRV
jgi:hypothetical protein